MTDQARLANRTWLDAPQTRELIVAFDRAEIVFRFVGGAVRDGLLDRPVADIDIATPATPAAVLQGLAAAGIKAIPTGIAHGTVTALIGGRHFEITTLRRDVETDGRHAIVAFTDDWREDAARRDFTINALYADCAGAISDYFGGVADALAGRVRFIGDPARRIAEDGLRILRFFRFHAHYGRGAFDPDGLSACQTSAPAIDRLSGERIRDELFKLLRAPDPIPAWEAMIGAGVMARTVSFALLLDELAAMAAAERELKLPPDPLRRLAAAAGALNGDRLERLKTRLKLSNRDDERLRFFDAAGDRVALISRRAFGPALYRCDPVWIRDSALLSYVRSGDPDIRVLAELGEFIAGWSEPRFPLSGADLQARGISPGPRLGRLLDKVESWWAASDFSPDRAACLAELERLIGAE